MVWEVFMFLNVVFASLAAARPKVSNVSNILPRRDSLTGAILDIHDGNTIRVGDTFFWYGAGYGECNECFPPGACDPPWGHRLREHLRGRMWL